MLVEICFTALRGLLLKGNLNLMGHTSLWMFPVYAIGLSYGFDFIEYIIVSDTIRYLSYPFWIWSVELLVGLPFLKYGVRIWDYRYLPSTFHWKGIVSFAHYPLWGGIRYLSGDRQVKIGNLVRVKLSDSDIRGRDSGVVIRFDSYRPASRPSTEPIVEVLWESGLGWILKDRIEVIDELDELSDEQLECVHGGMRSEQFDIWRCDLINEYGK